MRLATLAFALLVAFPGATFAQSPSSLSLAEGRRLLELRELDGAQGQFERALAQAREEHSAEGEARAHYWLGKALLRKARYPAAKGEMELALPWFQEAGEHRQTGAVYKDLGYVAWVLGDRSGAAGLYRKSLAEFEAAGDARERASALYNLAFSTPPGAEHQAFIQQALDAARAVGDHRLEGMVLHLWGDRLFVAADFAGAGDRLERAASLFEQAGARLEMARVFTSLGRLYRWHGHPDRALAYYRRALLEQQNLDDKQGVIQSADALGIVHQAMNEFDRARRWYLLALDMARRSGSTALIRRQLAHLASLCTAMGRHAEALELLQEAAGRGETEPPDLPTLAAAYLGLGRRVEALATAEKAVERSGETATPSARADALAVRAQAKAALGRQQEAIADIEESLRLIEQLRARLVPTDFMRSGFAAQNQRLSSLAIELLHAAGRHDRTFEVAEQARARGFLDLLATHDLGARQAGDLSIPRGGALDIRSVAATPPCTATQAAAAAQRLDSTLLAYWVDPGALYIWVVRPGQPVRGVRVAVTSGRLVRWIAATSEAAASTRVVAGPNGGTVEGGTAAMVAWRRLYDVLIRPARQWLPTARGSLVTVVPHGPLFALSFAALLDEAGAYLIERHTLHSVPAAGVLPFTERRERRAAAGPASYLLVADPSALPPGPDGRPLARLPGSRREVENISRLSPPGRALVLTGEKAAEDAVLAASRGRAIVHLATHGVVRDDQPLDSFLALSNRGRLTTREIYGVELTASLVVLSGCRTARGKITGDGIMGLTRAFFYAGTPSVLATVWDVADQPTQRVMLDFYRSFNGSGDKARALRDAQLRLLRALRGGKVSVQTAFGPVVLPEHPLFWAGFVLQGEP